MSIEENRPATVAPEQTAYGKVFRERGTLRVVLLALALGIGYYTYSAVHVHLLNQKKWAALQPEPGGLTVLGLPSRYVAIEASHAWQIRRRDDVGAEEDESEPPEETPEAQDRGSGPAAAGRVAHGGLVSLDYLMKTCAVVLTGRHFTKAWVVEQSDFGLMMERKYWQVQLEMSEEGSSRYFQYSQDRKNERLVFALNGMILTCPRINPMYTSSFEIGPIWVKADAEKLAASINRPSR